MQFCWVYNHNVQIETMKIENGEGRTILLVSPHADDPAFFLGGVIALWAEMGWRVICVRVTDDRWDSHGLSESQTIENNTKQFQAAASVLGISEIVEFFSAYDTHLTHSRPLVYDKIKKFGLNIELANGDLKDLLWEVYILINGFFTLTPFVKLFENKYGISWGRQFTPILPQHGIPQQETNLNPINLVNL